MISEDVLKFVVFVIDETDRLGITHIFFNFPYEFP